MSPEAAGWRPAQRLAPHPDPPPRGGRDRKGWLLSDKTPQPQATEPAPLETEILRFAQNDTGVALRMTERSSLSPLGRAIVRRVVAETTTKALLIAVHADPAPCVATINRLNPEHLCFFIPEELRPKIETDIQPNLAKLPKKWDWILTPDPHGFGVCYKALNQPLADLLKVWGLQPGELTVDLSRATSAMAAATGLATLAHSSQFITLKPALVAGDAPVGELVIVNGTAHTWQQDNPWTDAAITARSQGAEQFNRGSFAAAAATCSPTNCRRRCRRPAAPATSTTWTASTSCRWWRSSARWQGSATRWARRISLSGRR